MLSFQGTVTLRVAVWNYIKDSDQKPVDDYYVVNSRAPSRSVADATPLTYDIPGNTRKENV